MKIFIDGMPGVGKSFFSKKYYILIIIGFLLIIKYLILQLIAYFKKYKSFKMILELNRGKNYLIIKIKWYLKLKHSLRLKKAKKNQKKVWFLKNLTLQKFSI